MFPFFKKKSTPSTQTELDTQIKQLSAGMVTVRDLIAPEAIDVDFNHMKLGEKYTRTLFVAGYPRFVAANWLSPLVNFDHALDVSMYIYPIDGKAVMDDLRKKITEMEAELMSDAKQGKISDINIELQLEDARMLQEQLAAGVERFYQFGLYITISAISIEELNQVTKQIQSTLGSLLIVSKSATLQMEDGFKTTLPLGIDRLLVTRNMDTTSLATTFPFTSSELSSDQGIMYGINEHNDSLVVFDRFSLENANMVVFAKSGSGKSYTVKLECLRSLMFDTEVIVIDPEDEYREMCASVSGEYINFSFNSEVKINPFDLSNIYEEGENELGLKILSLHSLLKVMLKQVSPEEEAILDRALISCYKAKGITPDPSTQNREPPLMEDLYKALQGMETEAARNLSFKLEKFIKGSFRGIFDQKSNIDIRNEFTVFGIKEMEDELRPIAMFIILDFIWTRIRRDLKRRILVVDEAWYLMKYPDSASFLKSLAKRARKYYLGVTTITQDVEDFLSSEDGKAIVTNSSLQLLLKQSTAAIDRLQQVFYLSEGEKRLLLSADVGEGLFFAGQNHVALRIVASADEHYVITTNPQEVINRRATQSAATQVPVVEPAVNNFSNPSEIIEPDISPPPSPVETPIEEPFSPPQLEVVETSPETLTTPLPQEVEAQPIPVPDPVIEPEVTTTTQAKDSEPAPEKLMTLYDSSTNEPA